MQCVASILGPHDESPVVLHGRVIEVDVGDGIEIRAASRLLLALIRVVHQHLPLAVEHEPAIVGAQVGE